MTTRKMILSIFLLITNIIGIFGTGKLWDPVNRSSAWRKGFNTTKNYNDYMENCGGYSVLWDVNNGKCGECGDDIRDPRPRNNENGGLYGSGIIVKTYKSGETIPIVVDMMSNHLGYFRLQLCPLNQPKELENEECFAKYPIKFADGSDRYQFSDYKSGIYESKIVLPSGLKCEHCVLRWEYIAGNRWGICENGQGALGCGPQENFRTCSDIKID